MSWISVGVGIAGAATKLIAGHKQKKEGNALINTPMPQYEIPSEIKEQAKQGLPSQEYLKGQQDIERAGVNALSGAQDRRGGLSAISKIQKITDDAKLNLNVKNAQAKMNNQKVLAGYEDKAYQINKLNPYNRNYNYGMSVLGAGNQNTISGIDSLLGGVGNASYMGAFSGRDRRGTAPTTTPNNYQYGDDYGGNSNLTYG